MNYQITKLEAIDIAGIKTRTDNEKANNDISALWEKFFSGNYSSQIPNKISDEIVSLYTDYESDFTKPYTVIIGCKVKDVEATLPDLVSKKIPASNYAVFTVNGQMPQAIVNAWKEIWNTPLERTYTGDFELFDEKYSSTEPEAKIFIAIK